MRRATTTLLLTLLTTTVALAGPLTAPVAASAKGDCDPGEFCAWTGRDFSGARHTWDLAGVGIESCVPLPAGVEARSFANRLGRPVTTYQSRECATEGEFDTYPGDGTWVPDSPFKIRAFQVWEN